MVLAMSVYSCKARASLKRVESYTTKDWITYLILLIRAIKYCLENQYLMIKSGYSAWRVYSLAFSTFISVEFKLATFHWQIPPF